MSLSRARVTKAGLTSLASLPLRELVLLEIDLAPEDISVFERMPALEHVELSSPPFDAGNIGPLGARGVKVDLRPRSGR